METQRTGVPPRLASCARMPEWMRHFGHPTGLLGALAGHLMALKNRKRSLSVLTLVDPRPGERILEVGFGPGLDIRRVSRAAAFVAGVDPSPVMLRQAQRRNASAIRAGKVELAPGDVRSLPFADGAFDKAFSINSAQFWPEPFLAVQELRRVLRPQGQLVLAVQPRSVGADARTSRETAEELAALLAANAFEAVTSTLKPAGRVPIACAVATKPAAPGKG
ncbi:Methyltransferase domain-containing protein [Stigmatella aurantiaca]|uniref:Methyltransferase domain-containing protein n=1 Tax=Stigmatella aurantiaca TaxID=41 RepID=A0A1H7VLM8_STIAU|nr:methyltransferase domain-containing protein [Stigmatella aurantiaca]SEM09698.1 Methyltransferase domain-containing protein [Stigmatella aurantiaca]